MPSYRVTLAVGALAPGVAPDRILPAAKTAALEFAVVEAVEVQVVRGQARIVVRFTADDAELATQIGRHVASVTAELARIESWRVTERVGAQWRVVPARAAEA